MEVVVTTGAIRRAKLWSNHLHQHSNTQLFTGRMPFLSPNHVRALKEITCSAWSLFSQYWELTSQSSQIVESVTSFYRELLCVCVINDLAFDVQLASMSVCQLAGRGELSMLRRVLNGEHVFSNGQVHRLTECKWRWMNGYFLLSNLILCNFVIAYL